jgi:sarcosine oxidase
LANSQSFPTDAVGLDAANEIIHGNFVTSYDVIVIGTGGVGSAALYHLAKRGVKVLGLDRFPPGHDRGSSHGRTRIIRQAYFEHPDYVPLLLRAYELWEDLSQRSGKQLYHEIGLLQIGPPNGKVVPGVLGSARRHGLQVDQLTPTQVRKCFLGFNILDEWEAVFESRAGYLDVEDCVISHHREAQKLGAEVQTGLTVDYWSANCDGVAVATSVGQFRAAKLVIAAGPWAPQFLRNLGIVLEVRRKDVFWYPINDPCMRADHGCPAYLYEIDRPQLTGVWYGLPEVDNWGFKIAEHTDALPRTVDDPLAESRDVREDARKETEAALSTLLPNVGRPLLHHSVCFYTMSPGEDFIVDVHPLYPQVSFAAGLSGHGFKFTCVLGEALADLALNARTDLPIGFLNCRRFGTC